MRPGDLVFWEDEPYGRHHFWRIESVLLGALGQESVVRLVSLSHNPCIDEEGIRHSTLLVPEPLIRGRVFLRETPSDKGGCGDGDKGRACDD